MPLSNPDTRNAISPRKSPLHRRTRGRNLAILLALIALMAVFYLVTIVRIQTGLEAG